MDDEYRVIHSEDEPEDEPDNDNQSIDDQEEKAFRLVHHISSKNGLSPEVISRRIHIIRITPVLLPKSDLSQGLESRGL